MNDVWETLDCLALRFSRTWLGNDPTIPLDSPASCCEEAYHLPDEEAGAEKLSVMTCPSHTVSDRT